MPRSRRPKGTRNTRAISRSRRSVRQIPSSTFRYTGGNTISAEMNRDRLWLLSHTSARMMKDATGTVLTAATSGAISPRSHCFHAASAASATANTVASRNPPKIRTADQATVRQKAAVTASCPSRSSTSTGEANSSSPWG